MKQTKYMCMILLISTIDSNELVVPIKERRGVEAVAVVIMNFSSIGIDEYDERVIVLVGRELYSLLFKS